MLSIFKVGCMSKNKHTLNGTMMTDLILETFRLNGRLLAAGDKLVKPHGLTSARWQVLGAIYLAETPQPVAWLARSMGLTRQGVQRIANELQKDGLVSFEPNPNHRRASLLILTDKGSNAYAAADREQTKWVNNLAQGFEIEEIKCAFEIMKAIRTKLDHVSN